MILPRCMGLFGRRLDCRLRIRYSIYVTFQLQSFQILTANYEGNKSEPHTASTAPCAPEDHHQPDNWKPSTRPNPHQSPRGSQNQCIPPTNCRRSNCAMVPVSGGKRIPWDPTGSRGHMLHKTSGTLVSMNPDHHFSGRRTMSGCCLRMKHNFL